jgi:porin
MSAKRWLALGCLAGMQALADAQIVEIPDTWGGELASRPRLTGSWDGLRDTLGAHGLVLDVDLLLTPQSVLSGGRSTANTLWGNVEYALNLDTQKAGLWPGGFLFLEGNSGFGNSVLQDAGAVVPVNMAATLPGLNERTTALTNATFTQFLSEKFGMMLGKINTLDLGATEFYGDYHTQFMNTALVAPMTLAQVPLSAWGAGLIVLPVKDLNLSVFVLNAAGTPTSNPVFGSGVEVQPNVQWTVRPWGLLGHQTLELSWNDLQRYSLEQNPANIARLLVQQQFPRLANPGPELSAILQQFFPELQPTTAPNVKDSSWALGYTFDQFLWQPARDADAGVGVFFAFGASDGNPNPLRYSIVVGVGGKGVVPGRRADTFGIGFANSEFSSALLPLLREQLALGLQHENALEIYYNAALTGWLSVSADLQAVSPGLQKRLSGATLTSVDTAVIAGLRVRARF